MLQAASTPNESLVVSYLALRKAIGIVGISLPFVLALGNMLLARRWGVESSVSDYYYTDMRDVLVGSLCAIAVFLMSYRGPERADDIAGDLACVFAIGVALFPTTPQADATPIQELAGRLHYVFAALFFLTLAYFSLVLFRKTEPGCRPTPRKLQRNGVYTVCGWTILLCMALIPAIAFTPLAPALAQLNPTFWLEAAAVLAFGISWLVKGEAILKDEVAGSPFAAGLQVQQQGAP